MRLTVAPVHGRRPVTRAGVGNRRRDAHLRRRTVAATAGCLDYDALPAAGCRWRPCRTASRLRPSPRSTVFIPSAPCACRRPCRMARRVDGWTRSRHACPRENAGVARCRRRRESCRFRRCPVRMAKRSRRTGKAPLEDLRIGQARVGHVRVDGAAAVVPGAGASSAADGLVILHLVIAEGEVVHRALRRGHHAERAVQGIGDDLRRLDVAGNDGRRRVGTQHAAFGNDEIDRLQAALVHRDVFIDQRAEDVQHRRATDGGGGVEVGVELGRRAAEVDGCTAVGGVRCVTVTATAAPLSSS